MKILLVNTLYAPEQVGGAERVVKRLADSLRELGLQPVVACLSSGDRATQEEVDGVRVHRVPQRNVYRLYPAEARPAVLKPIWHAIDSSNRAMAAAVGKIVDDVRPDIVHTHNLTGFSPRVWASVVRRGVPLVHTLHDHYLLCARSTMFFRGENCTTRHLFCGPYSAARVRHSSSVHAVVGVSRFILDRHLDAGAFAGTPIRRVIFNPMFPVSSRADRSSPPVVRIGYLGRLEQPKGVETLLEACRGLVASNWRLEIAGTGSDDYERHLRAIAQPTVRFRGEVEAQAFLRGLDVLVVPSIWNEALGLVVVEALAMGVPVIASRSGGIPEIVHDGRNGFLVAPGSPSELRAVLERVLAAPDLIRSMRAAALSDAERFAPLTIAQAYVALYSEVAAGPHRPAATRAERS